MLYFRGKLCLMGNPHTWISLVAGFSACFCIADMAQGVSNEMTVTIQIPQEATETQAMCWAFRSQAEEDKKGSSQMHEIQSQTIKISYIKMTKKAVEQHRKMPQYAEVIDDHRSMEASIVGVAARNELCREQSFQNRASHFHQGGFDQISCSCHFCPQH